MKDRRGEIGETMTWFVATIVVVVILAISIFVVSLISTSPERGGINVAEFSDLLPAKSLSAFMLTKDGEKIIYEEINEDEDLNDFSGALSVKVLKELYSKEYSNIVLKGSSNFVEIDYPKSVKNRYWEQGNCLGVEERIYFPGNKHIRLCLNRNVLKK